MTVLLPLAMIVTLQFWTRATRRGRRTRRAAADAVDWVRRCAADRSTAVRKLDVWVRRTAPLPGRCKGIDAGPVRLEMLYGAFHVFPQVFPRRASFIPGTLAVLVLPGRHGVALVRRRAVARP